MSFNDRILDRECTMRIKCNYCGGGGTVPDDLMLRRVRCSRCNHSFIVTLDNVLPSRGRRKAKRIQVKGVTVDFGFAKGVSVVKDISKAGIGLEPTDLDSDFAVGETVIFDLYDKDQLILPRVEACVARVQSATTGCTFNSLNQQDKERLKSFLSSKVVEKKPREPEHVEGEADAESLEHKLKDLLYKTKT